MSLGIFICPDGSLKSKILSWKEKIQKELIEQPYTKHPAHLTIINSKINKENIAISKIRKYLRDTKSFNLDVKKNDVFWNDIITGGHTIYFSIERTKQLQNIQNNLAVIMSKYKSENKIPKIFHPNKLLSNSYKIYGFPFVGDHWIPHFTISSLKIKKSHKIIKEFLSNKNNSSFRVDKISIWRINKDKHQMLEEISLK